MGYNAKISNEEVAALDLMGFQGKIVVVDSAETMSYAEEVLKAAPLLGFDTETRPAFTRNTHHSLSLLQLSTDNCALLFRVKECPLSPKIIAVLENPDVLKIGAAIRDDIRALAAVAPFTSAGFIDLQSTIEQWGVEEKSVRKMAAIVLGIRVSKAQRLSNWDSTKLTIAQRDYAAMDAWVCREIFTILSETPRTNKSTNKSPNKGHNRDHSPKEA